MILLVDAYNVIRFIYPSNGQAREAQVALFLQKLSGYYRLKRGEVQDIIVVFDGGILTHKTREVVGGVVVVHAGARRKADDVLVHYAEQFREKALLVSNDRELGRRASVYRTASLDVQVFWQLLSEASAKAEVAAGSPCYYGEVALVKYEAEEEDGMLALLEDELDALMVEGSVSFPGGKEEGPGAGSKRKAGQSLSKAEKMRAQLRKKLG